MAINRVQFQKGLSLPLFRERYGTEEQCFRALFRSRWPHGFECPECGSRRFHQLQCRPLFQCADLGVTKIGKINVVPGSLIKDQHYSISYSADHATATIKILDLDRVRDDRVAFAVTQ